MKPHRFWAVVSRDGYIDSVSISDHCSITRAFKRRLGGEVREVTVRVVTPKPRKRKAKRGAK